MRKAFLINLKTIKNFVIARNEATANYARFAL